MSNMVDQISQVCVYPGCTELPWTPSQEGDIDTVAFGNVPY